MNKQEFKSAYNKITLSEEFKAEARAKLTEQFGKAAEKYPSDNVIEEHPAAAITLSPNNDRKKSPWKAVAGIGTAAAVVCLGIWGCSVWLGRTQNPLDGQQTTEVAETIETNESVNITSDMQLHHITFPAYYYDLDSKLYNPAMDMEPFVFTIALPQEWDIVVPDEDDMMGASMVFIMDGKECVGAIDCGIYKDLTGDEYGFEDVEYGHPDYHLMVLMDLMNAEYRVYPEGWDYNYTNGEKQTGEWIMQPFGIDTVEDYAEIKTDGTMTAASCTLYRYMADPTYINTLFYGSGVIAYDSATHTYVYACFGEELDEKLHTDIVNSVSISEQTSLTEQSIVFPAYYDKLDTNNIDIFSAVPFQMDISLPEGWEIMIPESEDRSGFSMVQILDEDGSVIGSMDFNVYEKYEGMEYGDPNYHQMVFNQLFLGSVVNWNFDYTEVKTDGWMKSATCSIYHNVYADGRNDDVEYTSGILAYEDDMQVYVNISFNSLLDGKLHTEIAESISITESTIGLAERLADLVLELEGIAILGPNGFTDIAVTAVDTPCGTYVAVAYPDQEVTEGYGVSVNRTLSLYSIHDNRLNGISFRSDGWICSFNSSDSVFMYENGEDILFVEEKTVDGYKTVTYKKFHPEECAFEELTYFRIVRNESGTYAIKFDDGYDGYLETHMTEAQYNEAVSKIMDGYTLIADLPCQPEDMTKNIATYYQNVVDVIEDALNAIDKQPVEEPAPMPPNIWLDAEGAERPLMRGSYTWGEGADEFHHDGYTIADIMSPEIGYVYPASWFDDARLVIPDGGVITSVTLHKDALTYTELEFTADGAIILPDDPIGEHIEIIVEYPEGACRYLMSVDFPETDEPPAVTLNGKELTIGSYIWNGELSGNHPRNADVYQMFLSGELLTVEDVSSVQLTLPESARLIEAICFGEDMETQMQLGSEESGEVRLPAAYVRSEGVIRLGVEYPDGSVSYWFGFRHETR